MMIRRITFFNKAPAMYEKIGENSGNIKYRRIITRNGKSKPKLRINARYIRKEISFLVKIDVGDLVIEKPTQSDLVSVYYIKHIDIKNNFADVILVKTLTRKEMSTFILQLKKNSKSFICK